MTCRTLLQKTKSKNNPPNLFWLENFWFGAWQKKQSLLLWVKNEVEFEYREKQYQNVFLGKLGLPGIWYTEQIQPFVTLIVLSSKILLFSNEISFEEFNIIMAETYKFDYRPKTLRTALFSNFRLTRIRSMDQNRKFLNRILLDKCEGFW